MSHNKKATPVTEEQKKELMRKWFIEHDQYHSNYNPNYQRTSRRVLRGGNCANLRDRRR